MTKQLGNLTVERLRTFTSKECETHGVENKCGVFVTFDEIWNEIERMENDESRNNWLKYHFGKCYVLE